MLRLALLVLVCSFASARGVDLESLPVAKIEAIKRGPCTLVHIWASWCTPCLEEMPSLIRFLEGQKKVTPIVVDMSSPFVQENFSKKFMVSIAPKFRTYLKPEGDDAEYRKAIDPHWKGALPYFALYQFGQKKQQWIGTVKFDVLQASVSTHCR